MHEKPMSLPVRIILIGLVLAFLGTLVIALIQGDGTIDIAKMVRQYDYKQRTLQQSPDTDITPSPINPKYIWKGKRVDPEIQ